MTRTFALAVILAFCARPAFAACANPAGVERQTLYNDASSMLQFCDGIQWEPMTAFSGTNGATCTAQQKGTMIYNDASNVLEFCNASHWIAMGPVPGTGGAGCSSPTGARGTVIYNTDYKTFQYCDGTFWRAMTAGAPVTLDLDFVNGRYILNGTTYSTVPAFLTAAGGTFTRASTGTYFDSTGVMQSAASGVARLDYDPLTLGPKGILIEEARTNYATKSAAVGTWAWSGAGFTIASNATTAPDATNTATHVTWSATANAYIYDDGVWPGIITVAANNAYTGSMYFKDNGSTGKLCLTVGTADSVANFSACFMPSSLPAIVSTGATGTGIYASSLVQPLANGWYRVQVTGSFSAITTITLGFFATIAGGDIYAWGGQLERASFATSYIPTAGASVTRSADVFNLPLPGPGNWFDSTKGTFVSTSETFEPYTNAHAGVYREIWLISDVGNNRLAVRAAAAFGRLPMAVVGDGVTSNAYQPLVNSLGNVFTKFAMAYSSSVSPGLGFSKDGETAVHVAMACVPDTSFGLYVGGNGGANLTGHIARLTYMPVRMPDAALPSLSR